jgi:hypothetical protein
MDSKELRYVLHLLREDLQERDIPHRTTMRKQIQALQKKQAMDMSASMLVSLLIYCLYNANSTLE